MFLLGDCVLPSEGFMCILCLLCCSLRQESVMRMQKQYTVRLMRLRARGAAWQYGPRSKWCDTETDAQSTNPAATTNTTTTHPTPNPRTTNGPTTPPSGTLPPTIPLHPLPQFPYRIVGKVPSLSSLSWSVMRAGIHELCLCLCLWASKYIPRSGSDLVLL